MLCKNCGSQIDDQALFCPECGYSVENGNVEADLSVSEPSEQENNVMGVEPQEEYAPTEVYSSQETDASEMNEQESPSFSLNTDGTEIPRKKKKFLPFLISGIAVVLATVLSVVFWPAIKGFFRNTFVPAEKLQEKVYEDTISNAFDSDFDALAALDSIDFSNMGYEGEIKISASSMLIKLLSEQSGQDLSWLKNVAVDYDYSIVDKYAQFNYTGKLNDSEIGTINQIMNLETDEQWISVPDYFSSVIYNKPTYPDEYLMYRVSTYEQLQNMQKLMSLIPSQEDLEKLLIRYCSILMSGFEEVEKSNEKVKVDGISQNLTVLTATMEEADLIDTLIDVLEALQDDQEIKDFLYDYEDYIDDPGYYDSTIQSIEFIIEELKNLDSDDMPDTEITLVTYLNGKSEIVGMELNIEMDDQEYQPLYFVRVEKGNKFASELVITHPDEASLVVEGSGSKDGKAINAEFDVYFDNNKVCILSLKDYVSSGDSFSGTLRIKPTKDVASSIIADMGIDSSLANIISAFDLAMDISMSGDTGNSKMEISLVQTSNGADLDLITIAMTAKMKEPDTITVPQENLVSELPMNQQFLALAKLAERLQEAGVPKELLENLTSGMVTGGLNSI